MSSARFGFVSETMFVYMYVCVCIDRQLCDGLIGEPSKAFKAPEGTRGPFQGYEGAPEENGGQVSSSVSSIRTLVSRNFDWEARRGRFSDML